MKKKRRLEEGYALFIGSVLLFLLSVSFISAAAFFRAKAENLEKVRSVFLRELENENQKLLAEWKNNSDKECE
ncbi:MAG: hypothetical protein II821_09055 [Treponema sp.]|nr:hypothetical protein [Treponema sp.]